MISSERTQENWVVLRPFRQCWGELDVKQARRHVAFSFTLLVFIVAAMIPAISAAAQPELHVDEEFLFGYVVPDGWRESAVPRDIEIVSRIIRKGYTVDVDGDHQALVLLTAQNVGHKFPTTEYMSFARSAFSDMEGMQIQGSIEKVGCNEVGILNVTSLTGTGVNLCGGSVPTARVTIIMPHGEDLIQYILLCKADQVDGILPKVKEVAGQTRFEVDPVEVLASNGIVVYESNMAQAPYDLVLASPHDIKPREQEQRIGRALRAQVTSFEKWDVEQKGFTWFIEAEKVKTADAVIVMKSLDEIGWIVPAQNFMDDLSSFMSDGKYHFAAWSEIPDRGSVAEAWSEFADIGKTVSAEAAK